jgi:hypothetical protein
MKSIENDLNAIIKKNLKCLKRYFVFHQSSTVYKNDASSLA